MSILLYLILMVLLVLFMPSALYVLSISTNGVGHLYFGREGWIGLSEPISVWDKVLNDSLKILKTLLFTCKYQR